MGTATTHRGVFTRRLKSGETRYLAQIRANGADVHLGAFTNMEDAMQAYDTARRAKLSQPRTRKYTLRGLPDDATLPTTYDYAHCATIQEQQHCLMPIETWLCRTRLDGVYSCAMLSFPRARLLERLAVRAIVDTRHEPKPPDDMLLNTRERFTYVHCPVEHGDTREIGWLEEIRSQYGTTALYGLSAAARKELCRPMEVQALTAPDVLVRALDVEFDEPPEHFDDPRSCVITGVSITEGYRANNIVPSSTSEFLDLLHGDVNGVMSINATRVYKSAWNMGSRLVFADGEHHHPLIDAKAAAAQGRASWSELVRDVWLRKQGQPVVAMITTDTKRRIWEKCRVGTLGAHTPVLIYNPERAMFNVIEMDWPKLLECLDLVERIYNLDFTKPSILYGLHGMYNIMQQVGIQRALGYEKQLRAWRDHPEFEFAVLIAQKES